MKKVVSAVAFLLLSVLLMNNAHAQSGTETPTEMSSPLLNMAIGIPEMIIILLFSSMAITILIVVIKKVTHK